MIPKQTTSPAASGMRKPNFGTSSTATMLVDGPLAKAVFCDACHVIPYDIAAPGHIDEAPAELTFGTLATTAGATPSWDHGQTTCTARILSPCQTGG